MKQDAKTYIKLFTSTFSLSAFTFGGGYVIVPLMKKQFVDHLHWIEEAEMLDLVALAQSAPGPMAVNASILLGYRVAGFPGAMVTILGTVLPPLIVLSAISLFYAAFKSNPVVSALLKGMQAGVAAVIADVVCDMGGGVLRQKKILPAFIMAGSFAAAFFLNINVVYIILACGLIGALSTIWQRKRGRRA